LLLAIPEFSVKSWQVQAKRIPYHLAKSGYFDERSPFAKPVLELEMTSCKTKTACGLVIVSFSNSVLPWSFVVHFLPASFLFI